MVACAYWKGAGEGVDVSAFSNITGQLIFSKIQQGWDQVKFIGDELFEEHPHESWTARKIPGIGKIKDEGSRHSSWQAGHP